MQKLTRNSLASMEFELNWQSREAEHTEHFFAPKVNLWRDIFPAEVEKALIGLAENETLTFAFEPGAIVPEYSTGKVLDLSLRQFRDIQVSGHKVTPQLGRFYPAGLLRNVAGIFPQSLKPFRVIALEKNRFKIDFNHPLSPYRLELKVRVNSIWQSRVERGGRCTDWVEEFIFNGPGMQARVNDRKTVFENEHSYNRLDENNDSHFYTSPRLVSHIDTRASTLLEKIYTKLLNKNDRVLDLMSSIHSHLPANYDLTTTGLGLNKTELQKNNSLTSYLVHDINETGLLPFGSNKFDAVVCSLSIEYLIQPRKIIDEINRVLVPGGRVLISFSNRWFPPKVTKLWLELHDFERLGLILDYLVEHGGFTELFSSSARNWPRPADDSHADKMSVSDPVYVVTGMKKLV
jgi:FKBP-type peptidyl-prolyl cis-trans isomerase 2